MTQAVEFEHQPKAEDDPLENTELARRLRRMEWPSAPPDVKQRCLEEILAEIGLLGDGEHPRSGSY